MARSDISAFAVGAAGTLLLTFIGFLIGVELAQYAPPPSPSAFIVPLVVNFGLGLALMTTGRVKAGKILFCGGSIASVALPFILL